MIRRHTVLLLLQGLIWSGCAPESNDGSGGTLLEAEAAEFVADARAILDEIDSEVAELDSMGAATAAGMGEQWDETKEGITRALGDVTVRVTELGTTTGERADELRGEVATGLETLTQRVEHAKLAAVDGSHDFVAAARDKLAEIELDLESLRAEVGDDAAVAVEHLRAEADDLRQRIRDMEEALPTEIAEAREGLAEAIATLSASIQREWFEARYDLSAE
jgi:hypothetical protein